jgi:hypothetical protein
MCRRDVLAMSACTLHIAYEVILYSNRRSPALLELLSPVTEIWHCSTARANRMKRLSG